MNKKQTLEEIDQELRYANDAESYDNSNYHLYKSIALALRYFVENDRENDKKNEV